MNANRHYEEDDLALYAMGLLEAPATAAIAHEVATSADTQRRLADVQLKLAAFAAATVELGQVPEGSLDRLMASIELDRTTLSVPARKSTQIVIPIDQRKAPRELMPWIGWGFAALLALSTGVFYRDRAALDRRFIDEQAASSHNLDVLKAALASQTNDLDALRAHAASTQSKALGLQKTVAGQAETLNEQTRAAASTERERDVLRGTVAAQASQVAQLTADQAAAERIFDALRDPTALRVTLKKPTSKAAPTGRATYIASKGTLVFLGSNLKPLKLNKIYELWLMPADGSNPIPAGTFAPDSEGNASVINSRFQDAVNAKGFTVTIENAGGSQVPTLPIILAGL
jgi:anti-sigma-K factor RskA